MSEKSEIDQDMGDVNVSSSSSSSSSIPFKKPRFLEKWLQDPKLSSWLRKRDDGRVWCAACKTHLNINDSKFRLTKHAKSLHHKMNMHNQMEGAGTSSGIEVPKNEMKIVEIRYCLFAIEHNVSFEMIQAFHKLNKCIIGSKLSSMQSIKLGRTKIRAIIRNVIDKSIVLDIQEMVQEKYFSIIIVGATTGIPNIKNLCILIRFINNKHLETHLLDLIGVKNATAENIFKCIVNSLNKFNLSISKIVGIGVDNASVMMGCNNSLMTRFKNSNSEIVTFAHVKPIKRRNDQFVEALNFLNPQVALDHNKHVGQIEIIIEKFPSKVIGKKVIDQSFLLASKPSADEKEKLKTLDDVEFWSTVSNLKDKLGNLLYDEVAKLAFICLSLPHSNTDVERYYSITKIKNKKRNKLNTDMVCALTRIKLYLQSKHIDACSFQISDQMLQCFNSEMYNKEKIPSESNGILLDETEDRDSDSDKY